MGETHPLTIIAGMSATLCWSVGPFRGPLPHRTAQNPSFVFFALLDVVSAFPGLLLICFPLFCGEQSAAV